MGTRQTKTTDRVRRDGHNEVLLVGRVSGAVEERTLPSGDRVVQLRLVVPRQQQQSRATPAPRRASVDTIDISCWRGPLRRKALRLEDGMQVQVHGALRRRFWRSGAGPVSRYEVEVSQLMRCHPAAAGTGEGPTMSP